MTEKIDRKQLKLKKFEPATETGGEGVVHGLLYKTKSWGYAVHMGHNSDNNKYPGTSPYSYTNRLGISTEAKMDVKAAMRVLNPVERTVITLFYIDDLPLKKIATITQLSEGTIKSAIHRAKTKMCEVIKYQQ